METTTPSKQHPMASERPTKRQRFGGKLVTVRVGKADDQQDFSVHEPVLKEDSPFFRAALEKRWKEGQSLFVELPEDEPEVFAAYLEWVYEKRVMDETRITSLGMLAKMYVLGEKIQDDKFCDEVIGIIADVTTKGELKRKMPSYDCVSIMYEGTPKGSPGRRCLADLTASLAHPAFSTGANWPAKYPEEFKSDLIWALVCERGSYQHKEVPVKKEWLKSTVSLAKEQRKEKKSTKEQP